MACVDYGALLKVDGVFLNKNKDLFDETSDTGYIPEKALYNGEYLDIKGNFFVYAGDEELLLAFYKKQIAIISHEKILSILWNHPFISEEIQIGNSKVKISRLEPQLQDWDWKTDHDPVYYYLAKGKRKRRLLHILRCRARNNKDNRYRKSIYKCDTQRYVAEWEHAGKKYEVIFGYGIDPDEEVYNNIKNDYRYTKKEMKILDRWFI